MMIVRDLLIFIKKLQQSDVNVNEFLIFPSQVRKMRSFKLSNHIGNVFGNWICMLWFRV